MILLYMTNINKIMESFFVKKIQKMKQDLVKTNKSTRNLKMLYKRTRMFSIKRNCITLALLDKLLYNVRTRMLLERLFVTRQLPKVYARFVHFMDKPGSKK